MNNYNWDIPPSTIKNDREWKKSIHGGFWCICYDIKQGTIVIRMVLKTSSNPGRLDVSNPQVYLVGPDGNRMDN